MELINGTMGGAIVAPKMDTPAEGVGPEVKKPLDPILGGKSVVVTEMSEMQRMVMESEYETAMHTINNLVPTPDERKEKQRHEIEERNKEKQKEIDNEIREMEEQEEDVNVKIMNEEIAAKREEPV